MTKVIVTIRDNDGRFEYDFEIPAEVEAAKFQNDIAELVRLENPGLGFCPREIVLINGSTGKQIMPEDNLVSAEVVNGDILYLYECR